MNEKHLFTKCTYDILTQLSNSIMHSVNCCNNPVRVNMNINESKFKTAGHFMCFFVDWTIIGEIRRNYKDPMSKNHL